MRSPGYGARFWTAAILLAGWAAVLLLCWPGQLSYDSVVQLHDGRIGRYHSWHPAVMAWLLGLGDAILAGPGLFVLFSSALLFVPLLSLLRTRPRVAWPATAAAAVLVLLPQCLLYQGLVWKDVLFANAAVAGFVFLAQAEICWSRARARKLFLVLSLAAMVLAALARQNGALVPAAGGAAVVFIAWRKDGAGRAILRGGMFLASAAALVLLGAWALASRSDGSQGTVAQLKLLRLYDLSGAAAADPDLPLSELDVHTPALSHLVRTDGARLYSPVRSDTLAASPALLRALAKAPPQILAAQWYALVRHRTGSYLRLRAAAFGWLFFTPDIAACRPVFTGIDGPAADLAALGLSPRRNARDLALSRYAVAFQGTPAFSHPAFALVGLGVLAILLRRRAPGDTAIAWLLVSSLAFSASFFVIAIACDYRYLYFADLAALAAALHLAAGFRDSR